MRVAVPPGDAEAALELAPVVVHDPGQLHQRGVAGAVVVGAELPGVEVARDEDVLAAPRGGRDGGDRHFGPAPFCVDLGVDVELDLAARFDEIDQPLALLAREGDDRRDRKAAHALRGGRAPDGRDRHLVSVAHVDVDLPNGAGALEGIKAAGREHPIGDDDTPGDGAFGGQGLAHINGVARHTGLARRGAEDGGDGGDLTGRAAQDVERGLAGDADQGVELVNLHVDAQRLEFAGDVFDRPVLAGSSGVALPLADGL